MSRRWLLLWTLTGVLAVAAVVAPPVRSQMPQDEAQRGREIVGLPWQAGPSEGRIGAVATVTVQDGQAFLDGPSTRRFLELTGNPPRDERYTLAPVDLAWVAIFFFEDTGYVRDDEQLDADLLLGGMQKADETANQERQRLGMPALYTDGWHVPPHYDPAYNRLEWGTRLRRADGVMIVNYTIRLLGRRGVVNAVLVSDPEHLNDHIAAFRTALAGYAFVPGERYSEFRAGDRVAEYGLAALVLGGAAVVATKTGFAKAIGKFVVLGLVAAGGAVAAFFRRLRRRG